MEILSLPAVKAVYVNIWYPEGIKRSGRMVLLSNEIDLYHADKFTENS
jgi:hypothetical protein